MKIGYLGAGSWGYCLASLLGSKNYEVVCWALNPDLAHQLQTTREHPLFPGIKAPPSIHFTSNLSEALQSVDFIVESVTASGLRSVCSQLKKLGTPSCPFVITSKGIERNTGYIMPEVVLEELGDQFLNQIGFLSGPSYAQEVIKGLPTSVVAAAYDQRVMTQICEIFTTKTFRVYPNSDIRGVALGGALKNIIAIACGISDGLQYGYSSKAALMTRGLHEIQKLALAKGCKQETLYGLSGMGDLYATCSSTLSRNFLFGQMLARGVPTDIALKKIGMVVEGATTCIAALQLSRELKIPMPITEMVYRIIYEQLKASDAVELLMLRAIKEEHL
jgi:glycerol-3-phosphate dehydrogenase (NAD(P)+)